MRDYEYWFRKLVIKTVPITLLILSDIVLPNVDAWKSILNVLSESCNLAIIEINSARVTSEEHICFCKTPLTSNIDQSSSHHFTSSLKLYQMHIRADNILEHAALIHLVLRPQDESPA